MAIALLARAAQGLAKAARAVKGLAAKASRAKTKADAAYNARRRLKRQAERFEKQALSAEGSAKKRMESLAESLREAASRTYKREDGTYDLRALAQGRDLFARYTMQEERQADILMRSHIGSRIYAATVDVWKGLSYDEREAALWEEFGVSSNADLIKLLEKELGEEFYAADSYEKYLEIVLKIVEMRRS